MFSLINTVILVKLCYICLYLLMCLIIKEREREIETLQYSTVQYSTVQYSTVQYSTVQYSTVQYSTVQYSIVQYSTVQYSTVQYIHDPLYDTLTPSACNGLHNCDT